MVSDKRQIKPNINLKLIPIIALAFLLTLVGSLETIFIDKIHSDLFANPVIKFSLIAVINLLLIGVFILIMCLVSPSLRQRLLTTSGPDKQEYYLAALETVQDGICIIGNDGMVSYANDSFCKYHG